MAPFHAEAWWAAMGLRVIAAITLGGSELLLRDVDAKGFLDIELVWQLRQKEGLKNVRGKICRKLKQNESAFCFEGSVLSVLAEAV
jgi:hypothetical protein